SVAIKERIIERNARRTGPQEVQAEPAALRRAFREHRIESGNGRMTRDGGTVLPLPRRGFEAQRVLQTLTRSNRFHVHRCSRAKSLESVSQIGAMLGSEALEILVARDIQRNIRRRAGPPGP